MSTALITGASRGLGLALGRELSSRGWDLVISARHAGALREAAAGMTGAATTAVPGDIADPAHRAELAAAAERAGGLDLLVNNASTLGPSPLPPLALYPVAQLRRVYEVNTLAPLALIQALLPLLARPGATIVNVTSDAAVEAYEGWGGYGSSKAALDQITNVLASEHPGLHIYAFDPGDMRTAMHQEAFPGEDISDRPEPETVVPALLRLIDDPPPSGRYRGVDLLAPAEAQPR